MQQLSIFDFMNNNEETISYNKPIRLIELFSGIGAQSSALKRLGVNFESYKTSEWEVNAVASYKAIHCIENNIDYAEKMTEEELIKELLKLGISSDGKSPLDEKTIKRKNIDWKRTVYNNFLNTNNIGSITNIHSADLKIIDKDKYTYLLTYSFPCQDLSIAGKQRGMAKGQNTRSGLLWEVERLLYECKEQGELPDILLMENVPQVHGKKFINDFNLWLNSLENLGYHNYWQDINAKDYGIAQNRNRTFMISTLENINYEFPNPISLTTVMADYLEDIVDEKYYIENDKSHQLIEKLIANGDLDDDIKKNG